MAQTTILASGTSSATSTDVTLGQGETVTIGLFASASIPPGVQIAVRIDTPGDDGGATVLNAFNSATILAGPGTYRAVRPDISAYSVSVGVYTEDGV